jgi:hypothetical protein
VAALIPCAAVFFGSRAKKAGQRRGHGPLVIRVITGIGLLALTIISEIGQYRPALISQPVVRPHRRPTVLAPKAPPARFYQISAA